MSRVIVYTRRDGGVSICRPSTEVVRWMACGGMWDDYPRGFMDVQVERQIKAGHLPDAALRFARAIAFGGCPEWEAYQIIRDRDCGHLGTGHELWDADDCPSDRWFRDAWTRSHNGGPIRVDLAKARGVQFRRARDAVDRVNRKRAKSMDQFDDPIEVDWSVVRDAIRRADDVEVLRRVWPKELTST